MAVKTVVGKKIPRWKHRTGSSPVPGTIFPSLIERQSYTEHTQKKMCVRNTYLKNSIFLDILYFHKTNFHAKCTKKCLRETHSVNIIGK